MMLKIESDEDNNATLELTGSAEDIVTTIASLMLEDETFAKFIKASVSAYEKEKLLKQPAERHK